MGSIALIGGLIASPEIAWWRHVLAGVIVGLMIVAVSFAFEMWQRRRERTRWDGSRFYRGRRSGPRW
jgi:hypothetical protein